MTKPTLDLGFKSYLQSLSFLWNYRVLWTYLLLAIAPAAIDLYLKNRPYLQTNFPQFPQAPEYLIEILPALGIVIGILGAACIIIHSFALLDEKQTSIGETCKTLFSRLFPILLWIVLCILAMYLNGYITSIAATYLKENEYKGIFVTLVSIAYDILKMGIGVITSLVLPALIFEQRTILESFKRGILLSKQLIWAIIGGSLGLAMTPLIFLPFAFIITFMLDRMAIVQYAATIRIILNSLLIIPFMFIACAFFVFQAKLYHAYYKEMPE